MSNIYSPIPEEDDDEEQIELTRRQKLLKIGKAVVALVAVFGLVYISGIRPLLLYRRTPIELEQREVNSQLDARVFELPLLVYVLRGPAVYGSKRSQAEVDSLVANASRIWQQADISLQIRETHELELTGEELELFIESPRLFISKYDLANQAQISVLLVGNLAGINGLAFGGLNTVAVADYTTVFDFRALAHEIGHILGLVHVDGSRQRLMYRGANGKDLSLEETMRARERAELFALP